MHGNDAVAHRGDDGVSLPLITHIVQFGRKLHDAGIDVNPSNLIDLSRSLLYIDIANYDDFYAAALATLIINREDMELFSLLFREYWQNRDIPFEDEHPPTKRKMATARVKPGNYRNSFSLRMEKRRVMQRNTMATRNKPVIQAVNYW